MGTTNYKTGLKNGVVIPIQDKSMRHKVVSLADVQEQKQEYLLYPYIPKKTYVALVGQSGAGKTYFTLYIASIITNGLKFLTDRTHDARTPAKVIYQTRENSIEEEVKKRSRLLGINEHNFFIIKDELEDGKEAYLDITTLENDIAEIRPALIILDPIQSYLPEDTNMNSANEIRRVMDNIAALAKKYDTTFLLIMHPNKMTSVNDPLDRMLGSSDFRNAARSVLVVGFDPEDKERRAMVHAKSSVSALGGSITFKITDNGISIDEDTGELNRFEIFNAKNKERDKHSVTLEEAKDKLENAIRDTGYIEKNTAIEGMTAIMDVSERTIQRARQSLGLETVRAGQGREHIALWVNPYVWENPKDAIFDYKARMAENDV